jgi:hypothetical protein
MGAKDAVNATDAVSGATEELDRLLAHGFSVGEDVAVRPAGDQWRGPNDDAGVAALAARLVALVRASGGQLRRPVSSEARLAALPAGAGLRWRL